MPNICVALLSARRPSTCSSHRNLSSRQSPQSFPGRKLAPRGGTPCLKSPRWQREEAESESSSRFPVSSRVRRVPLQGEWMCRIRIGMTRRPCWASVLGVQRFTLLSCSLSDFVEESEPLSFRSAFGKWGPVLTELKCIKKKDLARTLRIGSRWSVALC